MPVLCADTWVLLRFPPPLLLYHPHYTLLSLLFLILLLPGSQVHTGLMLDPNFHLSCSSAYPCP